ncbi:MAG: ABC transporter permease [Oxalobacter formigenes]|nr:ABC transporter permease [Oxalobacter formigenes]
MSDIEDKKIVVSILRYRGFIFESVKREIQGKYRNSIFGALWLVISPLATIVVYMVVFGKVMGGRLPSVTFSFSYGVYLCSGILTWGIFQEISARLQYVFLENANLLKKLNLPVGCLLLTVVFGALFNFLIIFSLFSAFLMLSGNFPWSNFAAAFPLLFVLIVFSIGLGMVLGILNVFFRDVAHMYNVLLNFWFWLTPIVYTREIIPPEFRRIIEFNPLSSLMAGFQDVFVFHRMPAWLGVAYPLTLGVILCFLGFFLFERVSADIIDEL